MFSTIKPRTRSQKAARTRARNKYAPERAALRPEFEPEIPADGLLRKSPKHDGGHERVIPVTPEATGLIYDELFARSGGHCEGCKIEIFRQTFHPHHFLGRTRGKKCWCLECLQALCEDRALTDNTVRYGCHSLAHLTVDESGKFDPDKSTRLGQKFERGHSTE